MEQKICKDCGEYLGILNKSTGELKLEENIIATADGFVFCTCGRQIEVDK